MLLLATNKLTGVFLMTFVFFYRFITIVFYLNDVEEGGETAFPVADNATFSTEVCIKRHFEDWF